MKRYSIEEIKYYLSGNKLLYEGGMEVDNLNTSLSNSINQIEDSEDGIEAVLYRKKRDAKTKSYSIRHFVNEVIDGARTLFRTSKSKGEI